MSYAAYTFLVLLALLCAAAAYVVGQGTLAAEVPSEEPTIGDFTWQTDTNTPPGDYFVDIQAVDEEGNTATKQVKITVLPAENNSKPQPQAGDTTTTSSDGGDSGGDGGGGGSSGDGSEEVQQASRVLGTSTARLTYQAESGHTIAGSYSGIEPTKKTVVLAHSGAVFERRVTAGLGDYWLEARVKHDRPGPVKMGVFLNGRLWKAVTLDKNDNVYRTVRIGLLRRFAGGTIRFGLLNDTYDKSDPANAEKDRNLHIDWWQLVADGEVRALATHSRTPRTAGLRSVRSPGWNILPTLNSYITQELGQQHVNFDIWQYYAQRLTVPTSHRASIQTDDHLRTTMRFWKGARPDRPRGDAF